MSTSDTLDEFFVGNERFVKLGELASGGRSANVSDADLFAMLWGFNQARCRPPLDEDDVRGVQKINGHIVPNDEQQAIASLNAKHAVVDDRGKVIIITESEDPVLKRTVIDRSSSRDIKLWYCSQQISVKRNGATRKQPLGDLWLSHPGRRTYNQMVFDPEGKHGPDIYNLWKGFAVKPAPGSWSLLQDHLHEIIASRNDEITRYFLGWMARAVQKPGHPGEVGLVMKGPQGTGKGILARSLGHLFGQHFVHVSRTRHLTGNFNAHLQDAVFVFADEAVWGGDKKDEGALKALITEPTLPIERKGVDTFVVKNVIHLMLASNSEWAVPAGIDDRRFCVVSVPPTKRDHHSYFNKIVDQLEHGGYEAMLYDLQHYDLSTFDHRKPPKTPELLDQKIRSFSPIQRWWFEKLKHGYILSTQERWTSPVFREVLHDDYISVMDKAGVKSGRSMQVEMGRALMKLLPDGWPKGDRLTLNGIRGYTYRFPELAVCRQWFADQLLRQSVEWGEPGEPQQDDLLTEEAA